MSASKTSTATPTPSEPKLQGKWLQATVATEAARSKLDSIREAPAGDVGDWTTSIPTTASQVRSTVYGAATKAFCDESGRPGVTAACVELRRVLEAGVEEDEIDDLDEAVKELNIALGLRSSD